MGKVIGCAADFYRLRVTRMDQSDEPELEWRDDILYREPPRQSVKEAEAYAIEAVSIDDEDDVTVVAVYDSSDAAYGALEGVSEDLDELTKSGFEERYFQR